MTDTPLPQPSLAARLLRFVPIVGTLVRDAAKSDEALLFAALNFIMLWIISGFVWGIAGVLAIAIGLAATMLTTVCVMMVMGGKIS